MLCHYRMAIPNKVADNMDNPSMIQTHRLCFLHLLFFRVLYRAATESGVTFSQHDFLFVYSTTL